MTSGLSQLPIELLETVLSYSSCTEISRLRMVCRRFNHVCSYLLTCNFVRLGTSIRNRLLQIKMDSLLEMSLEQQQLCVSKCLVMESLRSEYQILHAMCWRSLERKISCFFAGEILDKFQQILDFTGKKMTNVLLVPMLETMFKFDEMFFKNFHRCVRLFPDHTVVFVCIDILNCCYGNERNELMNKRRNKCLIRVAIDIKLICFFDSFADNFMKIHKKLRELEDLPGVLCCFISAYNNYVLLMKLDPYFFGRLRCPAECVTADWCHDPFVTNTCSCNECQIIRNCYKNVFNFSFVISIPSALLPSNLHPSGSSDETIQRRLLIDEQALPEDLTSSWKISKKRRKIEVNLKINERKPSLSTYSNLFGCFKQCVDSETQCVEKGSENTFVTKEFGTLKSDTVLQF